MKLLSLIVIDHQTSTNRQLNQKSNQNANTIKRIQIESNLKQTWSKLAKHNGHLARPTATHRSERKCEWYRAKVAHYPSSGVVTSHAHTVVRQLLPPRTEQFEKCLSTDDDSVNTVNLRYIWKLSYSKWFKWLFYIVWQYICIWSN